MERNELDRVRAELRRVADDEVARFLQRYFKTGPGEYGEGDRFLGIRVPVLRRLARANRALPLAETLVLLRSPWHEERMLALLILVEAYRRGDAAARERIHDAYLAHTTRIDNWDLVDASAPHIVGAHLDPADLRPLERLAASDRVWERRIAMLATLHWTRRGEPAPALHVARRLLADRHDLIHKAVGWMLREVGQRDRDAAERFLRAHHRDMPRTMLRYAVERFPATLREAYLKGTA